MPRRNAKNYPSDHETSSTSDHKTKKIPPKEENASNSKEANKMSNRSVLSEGYTRRFPGARGRCCVSWISSFVKLAIFICGFVLFVYIYDKRILYGFAEKTGWLHSNEVLMKPESLIYHGAVNSHVELGPNKEIQSIRPNVKSDLSENMKNDQGNTIINNTADESNGFFKYHILQSLTNTHTKPHLKTRFEECTRSILTLASINLHFFFVVDEPSKKYIMEIMQTLTDEGIANNKFQFSFLDIDPLAKELAPHVSMLQEQVTGHHPYYSDTIFFLSVALHEGILPDYVHRLAMMDTDLKFKTDIKRLFDLFDDFKAENIMAIAHEQQPVYRHIFSLYRSKNPGTKVGDPPPDGLTGFNSGVLLIDVDRMGKSSTYKQYLDGRTTKALAEKYFFKGHLGDQDFFTLLCLEHPELFYVLPCSWNRQLCQWWRDKGYSKVFDLYFTCEEPINIYHGNCNTPIPV